MIEDKDIQTLLDLNKQAEMIPCRPCKGDEYLGTYPYVEYGGSNLAFAVFTNEEAQYAAMACNLAPDLGQDVLDLREKLNYAGGELVIQTKRAELAELELGALREELSREHQRIAELEAWNDPAVSLPDGEKPVLVFMQYRALWSKVQILTYQNACWLDNEGDIVSNKLVKAWRSIPVYGGGE